MNDATQAVLSEIRKAVIGKDTVICKIFMAILAQGHILMEDCPGVGKTTTALAFSKALALKHNRLQFTPEILPADVVGFSMLNKATGALEFQPGAVLCNLLLADELNRASARTQSALLEAMEEGRVTVDGVTREIPRPFTVIATQNPFGSAGTQPLPESQMDRFMIRIFIGYPTPENEMRILKQKRWDDPLDLVRQVADGTSILRMQQGADAVYICDELYAYIVRLATATRESPLLQLGVSPRASIALARMSKASAWILGRDFVIPGDIQSVLADVWEHRLILSGKARRDGMTAHEILSGIAKAVPAPKRTGQMGERYGKKMA